MAFPWQGGIFSAAAIFGFFVPTVFSGPAN
jgi:hypothetical protein